MKIAIHQPNFFPRIKVLQKIARSDLWVVLDDVQFMQREWQNRTFLRHYKHRDSIVRMTIPVTRPNGRMSKIDEIQISSSFSAKKAFLTFHQLYSKAPYWSVIESLLSRVFHGVTSLIELNLKSTIEVFNILEQSVSTLFSSQLSVTSLKSQRIVDICKTLGSTVYISGSGGRNYINSQYFESAGIEIEWQDWDDAFWRDVSYIDFLALYGPQALAERLTKWKYC